MVIVVTTNVAPRVLGFLASCMLEAAPGVYTSPRISKAVRERIWNVLSEWFLQLGGSYIVMIWQDRSQSSGQSILTLGSPPRNIVDCGGVFLVKS